MKPARLLLAALLAVSTLAHAADKAPRIGVQLWSVKDEVKRDFEGTLGKLAAMGFTGVEFAGEFGRFAKDPAALRVFLDRLGLQCAGAHLDFAALSAERFAATTAFYQAAGCRNLVIAMDDRAATLYGAALVARELSVLSAKLALLGMRIGYHNHAQEMAGESGQTPWDVIAAHTPAAAILQQDVGWTVFAGKDPVKLIKRYPGRTVSSHFKVKPTAANHEAAIVGRDGTDWAAVYAAARDSGGAQWVLVEQEDHPDGLTPLEAVAASLKGLKDAIAARP